VTRRFSVGHSFHAKMRAHWVKNIRSVLIDRGRGVNCHMNLVSQSLSLDHSNLSFC
jgi:hypothetical protein